MHHSVMREQSLGCQWETLNTMHKHLFPTCLSSSVQGFVESLQNNSLDHSSTAISEWLEESCSYTRIGGLELGSMLAITKLGYWWPNEAD